MTAAELSIGGLLNDGEDEARDSRMEASLSTLTSQVGTLMDSVRDLQSSLAGNVTALAQASLDQGAEMSTLKSALQAAVTATGVGSPARCSGDACTPVIEANGANIAIKAPNGAGEKSFRGNYSISFISRLFPLFPDEVVSGSPLPILLRAALDDDARRAVPVLHSQARRGTYAGILETPSHRGTLPVQFDHNSRKGPGNPEPQGNILAGPCPARCTVFGDVD